MSDLFEYITLLLTDLPDRVGPGACIIALAAICLIQYLYHVYCQVMARRRHRKDVEEIEGLVEELRVTDKDRMVTRLENHIIREFIAQIDIKKAIGVLLRNFVPNAANGFGVFVRIEGDRQTVLASRGLSEHSVKGFTVSEKFCRQVAIRNVIQLGAKQIEGSGILHHLTRLENEKVKTLYLSGLVSQQKLLGVMVTTSLYPAGASYQQQVELVTRLMETVAQSVEQKIIRDAQGNELRLATDILELCSVTDQSFTTPERVIERFLAKLGEKVNANRVSVQLIAPEYGPGKKIQATCGPPIDQAILVGWQQLEDRLSDICLSRQEMIEVDANAVKELGIKTPVHLALVVPLTRRQSVIGALCLTRRSSEPFDHGERSLLMWAANHLVELILKVVNYARIEQRARQDGLTELANRGEFDDRIKEELIFAGKRGVPCSLLMLDLDHFKSINDNYGHLAGDEVLRGTGAVLRRIALHLRPDDRFVTARYGGEEMAVLLPGIAQKGSKRIAEAIRRVVESTVFVHGNQNIRATMSIGVATFPDDAQTDRELVAAADRALYFAKQSGRNRVVCAGSTDSHAETPDHAAEAPAEHQEDGLLSAANAVRID